MAFCMLFCALDQEVDAERGLAFALAAVLAFAFAAESESEITLLLFTMFTGMFTSIKKGLNDVTVAGADDEDDATGIWRFLKFTTAQSGPGPTFTVPLAGVMAMVAQPVGRDSVMVWLPSDTFWNVARPVGSFCR